MQRHLASDIKLRWTIHQSPNWDGSGAVELRARGVTLTYARYAHADAASIAMGGTPAAAARPLACEWQFKAQVGELEVLDGLCEDASVERQPGAATRGSRNLLSQVTVAAASARMGASMGACMGACTDACTGSVPDGCRVACRGAGRRISISGGTSTGTIEDSRVGPVVANVDAVDAVDTVDAVAKVGDRDGLRPLGAWRGGCWGRGTLSIGSDARGSSVVSKMDHSSRNSDAWGCLSTIIS